MKSAVKAALITVSVIALLALTGCSLYRLVVTSQIKDGGRMENPDAYRAGKDLVEFEWRQNHRNFYRSFSLKFYQENDMPLLIGWFPSQSGDDEIRESQTGLRSGRRKAPSYGRGAQNSGCPFPKSWQTQAGGRSEARS